MKVGELVALFDGAVVEDGGRHPDRHPWDYQVVDLEGQPIEAVTVDHVKRQVKVSRVC